ncbi:sensor histidine kinase [Aquisalimonas sp.]|uniref:sensor histidine kinase n=1 Tax=Aquisalimonas sp. TaxID=1872621 RepID=UPI0025C0A798|nr:sensor histidine kinase [Aquisalimonas sp.]
MTLDLGVISAVAVGYLLLLFLIAYITDRQWLPTWLTRNPLVYVLSLGVYATTWSYYGSVGFAKEQGLNFLTIYLGVTLAFVLTPVLLMPILRLTRTYQLTSVADLFAFRFNSQMAGIVVTLLMLAGVLPYIALQIRAVAESTQVMTREASPDVLAFWFVVLVTGFTIIFGARHVSPREHHDGLVAAIAFESLMKLVALLLVAGVAIWQAFGGLGGMHAWLAANPEHLEALYAPAREGPWVSLLVLAFAAGFLLPRQFHMLFAENQNPGHLNVASWGFPLFLLALTLAIPPILWAAEVLQPGTPADYHVLGISLASGSTTLALLAYLGGISAASAMIVVSTLAISSMTLNHLVLPFAGPQPHRDLYGALRWARRIVMVAVIAAGYGFYQILEPTSGLVGWGLISFLAMAQLLPGIIGLLFWPRATSGGFIAGLLGGSAVWVFTVLLPPVTGDSTMAWLGLASAGEGQPAIYQSATFWSLALNSVLFVVISLLSRPDEREREAAAVCRDLNPTLPVGDLHARSPQQFVKRLASVMGKSAAHKEVEKAVRERGLHWDETRPTHLHGLRAQVERNISGMMGPVLARMIVDERLQMDTQSRTALAQNVRLIEDRLETSRTRLRGLAAELDRLRRYHRQIIEDLPLGVCAVAQGGRLVRWNAAIAELTQISMSDVVGRHLDELPAPWGPLLASFHKSDQDHWHRQEIHTDDQPRWYSLHKATIEDPANSNRGDDTVLLVEDLTDVSLLEQELAHSERLASIGRLAAGVAHEIGNPVTGICCLAQELRDDHTDAERTAAIAEDVLTQAQRINNIVQSLVRYAHGGVGNQRPPEPVDLAQTVDEAIRLTTLSRRARVVRFDNQLPQNVIVSGDPQQLVQVFVNLFSNATDACADQIDEARVEILQTRQEDDWFAVVVHDNGGGISADVLDHVLEPFVTTKRPGHGTGLGLPLVYNIVREHGGEVLIENRGGGTRVTLRLRAMPAQKDDGMALDHG